MKLFIRRIGHEVADIHNNIIYANVDLFNVLLVFHLVSHVGNPDLNW